MGGGDSRSIVIAHRGEGCVVYGIFRWLFVDLIPPRNKNDDFRWEAWSRERKFPIFVRYISEFLEFSDPRIFDHRIEKKKRYLSIRSEGKRNFLWPGIFPNFWNFSSTWATCESYRNKNDTKHSWESEIPFARYIWTFEIQHEWRMPLDTKSEISSFWNIEIRRICFRTNRHQRLNKFVSLNFY